MKKNFVIVILLLALIVSLGFIAYQNGLKDYLIDKGYIEENKKDTKKEEKKDKKETDNQEEEYLETVDSTVLDSIDKIDSAINNYCGTYKTYFTTNKVEAKDISNQLAYETVMTKLIKTNNAPISKENMEQAIKETFGKDYKFEHKTYSSCPAYTYNEQDEVYEYQGAECGGTCSLSYLSKVVKATKTNDKLEIYIRIVFTNQSLTLNDRYAFCKNADLTEIVGYATSTELTSDLTKDRLISQGSLYKLTFNKEDDNYVFASSELQQ